MKPIKICIDSELYILEKGIKSIIKDIFNKNQIIFKKGLHNQDNSIKELDFYFFYKSYLSNDDLDNINKLLIHNDFKIILFFSQEKQDQYSIIKEINCDGILSIESSKIEIYNCMGLVSKNKRYVSLKSIKKKNININRLELLKMLSKREREIVQLYSFGLNTLSIANKLSISYHTVNTHKKNIMKKWNINSTNEIIVIALDKLNM